MSITINPKDESGKSVFLHVKGVSRPLNFNLNFLGEEEDIPMEVKKEIILTKLAGCVEDENV